MRLPQSIDQLFSTFDDLWGPRIVARVDDYDVKIVKVEGGYVEHAHEDNDEYFHVLEGQLTIHLPSEGRHVVLSAGDVFVIPRGIRHRPVAEPGTRLLLFERRGTVNAGDAQVEGTPGIDLVSQEQARGSAAVLDPDRGVRPSPCD